MSLRAVSFTLLTAQPRNLYEPLHEAVPVVRVVAIIVGIILTGAGFIVSMGLVEILSSLMSWYRPDRLEGNLFWHPEAMPKREKGRPGLGVFLAALLILIVFLMSLGLLWALLHVGAPLEASVRVVVAAAHGNVLILITALSACFLVLSSMTFIAIRIFSNKIWR